MIAHQPFFTDGVNLVVGYPLAERLTKLVRQLVALHADRCQHVIAHLTSNVGPAQPVLRKALSWCFLGVCRAHAAPSCFIMDGTTRVADRWQVGGPILTDLVELYLAAHRRLRCRRAGQAADALGCRA